MISLSSTSFFLVNFKIPLPFLSFLPPLGFNSISSDLFKFPSDSEGLIAAVDRDDQVERQFGRHSFDQIVDATGCAIVPGLIDAHTHPVWAGDRVHEFAMKVINSAVGSRPVSTRFHQAHLQLSSIIERTQP